LKLAALDPEIVATGHGHPMYGEEMRNALHRLARRFDELAQPAAGRYVNEPAVTDETGVLYLPARTETVPSALRIVGISLAVASLGYILYTQLRKRPEISDGIRKKGRDVVQKLGTLKDKALKRETASSYQ
jgi:hypothetical protein